MADSSEKLDALNVYMDGKMNRYKLLFAVNGGAYTIGALILEGKNTAGLTMGRLAWGAILFTLLVHADIWAFGMMMRNKFFLGGLAFERPGRGILVLLCSLVIAGWSLAITSSLAFVVGISGILATAAEHQFSLTSRVRTRKPGND